MSLCLLGAVVFGESLSYKLVFDCLNLTIYQMSPLDCSVHLKLI
jgi:hypothetical protein